MSVTCWGCTGGSWVDWWCAAGVARGEDRHNGGGEHESAVAERDLRHGERAGQVTRDEKQEAHDRDAFRTWAAFCVGYERAYREGCSLGSLASEIVKTDLDVHEELADAFDQWRGIFRDGIEQLQRRGHLSAAADPAQLANLLLAAFQGGMLLAQVARDISPLKDALQAAIDHLESFATQGPGSLHPETAGTSA